MTYVTIENLNNKRGFIPSVRDPEFDIVKLDEIEYLVDSSIISDIHVEMSFFDTLKEQALNDEIVNGFTAYKVIRYDKNKGKGLANSTNDAGILEKLMHAHELKIEE